MPHRHLTPLLALLLALALPAGAGAKVRWIDTPPSQDGPALSGKRALRHAEAVVDGRGPRRGTDLTPLLRDVALKLPSMSAHDKARARKLLARPTDNPHGSSAGEPNFTVPEQPPYCTKHFCIHWVTTTEDAPPLTDADHNDRPDYVDQTAATFEHVYQVENVQLGWRTPKPDGTLGCAHVPPGTACANKTDVYLKELGDEDLYGFTATDPGQGTHRQHAYLVVDNDFEDPAFSGYAQKLEPLQVTAAHEYNHVLQYNYDVAAGTWMLEASATWMEDVVYTAVNDYLQYIPGWGQLTLLPLTNEEGSTDEFINKTYGNVVWNRWLQSRFGADTIRNAWEHLDDAKPVRSFAPGAYDKSLAGKHSSLYRAFTRFAADTAEWRASNSPFAEGSSFADVERALGSGGHVLTIGVNGLTVGASKLQHTAYALINVRRTSKARIKLIARAKRGARMAVALIGRTGSQTGGTMHVVLKRLPHGGDGIVTMPHASRYRRLTIALINGDARSTGTRFADDEWQFRPGASIAARLSSDFKPPRVTRRSPGRGRRHVSRNARVKVRFSERMRNVTRHTAVLRTRAGRKVRARVRLTSHGRRLTITPRGPLRSHKRYTVRLSGAIRDRGANRLPATSRSWSFTTRR
jgi:hypothetical protein